MVYHCPTFLASKEAQHPPQLHPTIRKGYFRRKSDSRLIQRFSCKTCGKNFSKSTSSPRYYQKARRINAPLSRLLVSGVSLNRAAYLLQVDPKTIARRFRFLAREARLSQEVALAKTPDGSIGSIQFDDLESSIHTKCKPVSVCIAVVSNSRKILGFQVKSMPAKGLLAKVARRKYGYRKDERAKGWSELLTQIKPLLTEKCAITGQGDFGTSVLIRCSPSITLARCSGPTSTDSLGEPGARARRPRRYRITSHSMWTSTTESSPPQEQSSGAVSGPDTHAP